MWGLSWEKGVGKFYGGEDYMKGTNGIMLESLEVQYVDSRAVMQRRTLVWGLSGWRGMSRDASRAFNCCGKIVVAISQRRGVTQHM